MSETPTSSFDELDERSLEQMADDDRPYGEVTAEDMSDNDLIQDGADLASTLGSENADLDGVLPLDHELDLDRNRDQDETIEDRIKQEIPDPASDIVPPDAGVR